jgi:hypothetical protein
VLSLSVRMRFARGLYWTYFALIKMGDHQRGGSREGKGKRRDLPSYCRFIVCIGEGRQWHKKEEVLRNKQEGVHLI